MLWPDARPLKLVSPDGGSLALSVDGYQYPESTGSRWDDNWLVVSGSVAGPHGTWAFRDPCLTTLELERLAAWLAHLAGGRPVEPSLEFVEPNLRFEYRAGPEPAIRVRLAHECAPPDLTGSARLEGVLLAFPLRLNDPAAAADAVRRLRDRFPARDELQQPGTAARQM